MAFAKTLLVALAVGYVAIAVLLWVAQERLMFLSAAASHPPAAPSGWRLEAIDFPARDGIRLAGVLLIPSKAHAPLVIYYGGNAEEATAHAANIREEYGERAVLL